MIVFKELVPVEESPSSDQWANLYRLHWALNRLRESYQKPLFVTSGFRSMEAQEAVYRLKNNRRRIEGLEPIATPLHSWHLEGAAADLADPDGALKKFCLEQLELLERLDLYCEAFEATPGWVHFQIYPPASQKRFFEP